MRNTNIRAAIILSFLGLGACSPKDPPAKPTWFDDVQPIFLGNCAHCHGAPSGVDKDGKIVMPAGAGSRYDVCDKDAFTQAIGDAEVKFGISASLGGKGLWLNLVDTKDADGMKVPKQNQMPPPPALRLTDYDIQVLKNWKAAKAPCGTRTGNHPPTAVLIAQKKTGTVLKLTFDILDADGDTVLGRIEAGTDKPLPIDRAGRHTVWFDGATTTPRVFMSDGTATMVAKELK